MNPTSFVEHKNLCLTFKIEGHQFEAVGFLSIVGEELTDEQILQRVAEKNGGAIGVDDTNFINEHLNDLPRELRKYYLVTGCPDPEKPKYLIHFYFAVNKWRRYRSWASLKRGSNHLVLRRVTNN